MSTRAAKPVFASVLDLGLRDVGMRNDPRGLARQIGKAALAGFVLRFVSLIALCAFLAVTGVGARVVLPLLVALTAVVVLMMIRAAKRSTPLVVKVRARARTRRPGS